MMRSMRPLSFSILFALLLLTSFLLALPVSTVTADLTSAPQSPDVTTSSQTTSSDVFRYSSLELGGLGAGSILSDSSPIVVEPSAIEETLPSDTSWDVTLTISNTSGSTLTWEAFVTNRSLIGTPLSTSPKTRVLDVPSMTAVPEESAIAGRGSQRKNQVTIQWRSSLLNNSPNILLLNADDDNNFGSPLQTFLQAYDDLGTVDLYDANLGTPSLAELQAYEVVVTWSQNPYADPTAMGDVLADYVDSGGRVIVLMFALTTDFGSEMQGRLMDEDYTAVKGGNVAFSTSCLGTYDNTHPIFQDVTDVCDLYRLTGSYLTSDSTAIAHWQDGEIFVGVKDRLPVVSITGYLGTYYDWTGQMADVLHNSINFLMAGRWLSVAPNSGTIPAQSSVPVTLSLDATDLFSDTYYADILIQSSSSVTLQVTVPVTMHVTGEPVAVISPTLLSFGEVFVGYTNTLQLLVENDGTSDLIVSDIAAGDPTLSVSLQNFSLPPGDNQQVSVSYAPTTTQSLSTTLTITTNDPLTPVHTVDVGGSAIEPPLIGVEPEAIEETLESGTSRDVTLTISNTGGSDLAFEIISDYVEDFENGFDNWTMTGLWNPEAEGDACGSQVSPFPSSNNAIYYGIDGTCSYNNGSSNSGELTMISPVTLPASGSATLSFWSYEQTECGGDCSYDNRYVEISTDGGTTWITLGEGDTEGVWYEKTFDLMPYAGSEVLVRFRFDSEDNIDNSSLGWMIDQVSITGYAPWLTASPSSGTVSADSSISVTVTLDATDLISGTYSADLVQLSNDAVTPQLTVPVTMHVGGEPSAVITPTLLDFGELFVSYTDTLQLLVENPATSNLVVSNITAGDAALSANAQNFSVPPAGKQQVTVTYAPTAVQSLSTTLTITTNDPLTPVLTVNVVATAIEPPIVGSNPTAIEETLVSGSSQDVTLTILNTGGSDLDWTIPGFTALGGRGDIGIVGSNSFNMYSRLNGDASLTDRYTFTNLGNNWSYATIQPYDVIVVDETDHSISSSEADALRMFYDSGKAILLGMDDVDNLSSAIRDDIYYIFGVTNAQDATFSFGNVSDHPIAEGITSIGGVGVDNDYFDENGAEWVVRGNDTHNYVLAYAGIGRTVIMGEQLNGWYDANPDLVRNALDWASFSWLSVNPNTGTVPALSSMPVTVTLNATELISDTYVAAIVIESNDPATPELTVPATLHVTGESIPVVTPELLDFGTVFVGYSNTLQLLVENEGADKFDVLDITASDPTVSANPTNFTLPGFGARAVEVSYTPQTTGSLSATLTISTNNPLTPVLTIELVGTAIEPPIISADPTSFDVTQDTGLVTTRTLLIENSGSTQLDFDLSLTNNIVAVDPISGTLPGPGQFPITVTFDTTTQPAGSYNDQIQVTSNDPATPTLVIPVDLTVVLVAPEMPTDPYPQDGQINVRVDLTLSWEPSPHASSYDLYLWEDGETKPGTPTASNLTWHNYNPPDDFPTDTTFHWQIVARNIAGDTTGAEWSFTTETLPELSVTTVNVPPLAFSGQSVELSWVVTNNGNRGTTASSWPDRVYISTSPTFDAQTAIYLGQALNPAYLGPGESYLNTATFNLPEGISGDYYAFVLTDYHNAMREFDDSNNTGRSNTTFDISLTPPPDLEVTSVSGPANAFSGDSISVDWTVQNNGAGGTISSSWSDRIYLSEDTTFDNNDTLLRTLGHSGALASGESYDVNTTVNLPQTIFGDYYLFVVSDIYDQVYEHVGENNNTSAPSDSIAITLTPPPDLEVTSLVVPDMANSGDIINVSWEVSNNGAGDPFESYWQDRVYLSTSPTFTTTGATVLDTVRHSGGLAAGSSYTVNRDVTLPNGISSAYYIHIWSDYANQVFEFNADDNNTATSNSMTVTLAPSPDLQVINVSPPLSGTAGTSIQVSWTVQNGGDNTPLTVWHDKVYLSSNATWSGSGILQGTFERPQALTASESYTQTRNMVIPGTVAASDYYIYVLADANNTIYEHNAENNNVGRSSGTTTVEAPPAAAPTDLVIGKLNAPTEGDSGQSITVGWTVTNTSGIATQASSWTDAAYLSTDTTLDTNTDTELGTWGRSGALGADQSYNRTQTVNLPNSIEDEYYIFFVADLYSQVNDNDRTNNSDGITTPISITLSPPPDLQPTPVDPPSDGLSGQPLTVEWAVTNAGTGAAGGAWYDAVYFSDDPLLDVADTQLMSRHHTGGLNVSDTYTPSASLTIPNNATGNYYLLVKSDSRNDVYEHNAEANNVTAWPITITVPPPADLVVASVTVPPTAIPGAPVTIDWAIANQGTFAASGYMCDTVFLSVDTTWDIDDVEVGQDCRTINLGPGVTETLQLQSQMPERSVLEALEARAAERLAALEGGSDDDLPGVTPGQYYAIVRTDILNHIPESDETNNAGASTDTILVDVEELTLGVAVSDTLGTNEAHFYRVDVPAGETLLVSLDSDSTTAANELYVRYGQAPSRGNFDFGPGTPFEPDQEVVVPTTQGGTYYIMLHGANVPGGAQPFTLVANLLEFEIRGLDITEGGQGGPVTIKLDGAQFTPDARVFLENGGNTFEAAQSYFQDPSTLYVTFDLSEASLGNYDVVARYEESYPYITATTFSEVEVGGELILLPDDPTVITVTNSYESRLPGAFSVVPPIAPLFDIEKSVPSALRPNQSFQYSIRYANRSNNDIAAPLLLIYGDPNVRMLLPGDSEAAYGAKRAMAQSHSGPAGILRPGESGVINVFGYAPSSGNLLHLDVDPIRETNEPFDLDIILRDAGLDPTSPTWATAVAELMQQLDGTWSTYETVLSDYANQKWGYDTSRINADQLLLSLLADLSQSLEQTSNNSLWQENSSLVWNNEKRGQELAMSSRLDSSNSCSSAKLTLYKAQLELVAVGFPPNASYLLNKYLNGPSGNETFNTSHQLSRAARQDPDFKSPLHSTVEPQAKSEIEQQIKSGANSIANFSIPGSLPKPKLDVTKDLKYSINGTQGTTAEVININLSERTKDSCEGNSKTVSYKATIRYRIMDNYNFTKQDADKPGSLGYFGGLAYYLEQCGETFPYQTFTIIEEEISGEVQIDESNNNGEDCDPPDDDDDDGDDVPVVQSVDPNDILGPPGHGDAHWIAADSTLNYMIRYENDEELATAPAQQVVIEQTLDSDLDARRFRLGSFGFGDYLFEVPENRSFYQTRLGPLEVVSDTIYVDVNAGIDITTGKAFWILQTIDPATGAPPTNPLVGFLPPDVNEGEGQGFVTYSIKPKSTVATGDVIDAEASIVFDDNDPIDTPPIFNTLDADEPTSAMDALPAEVEGTEITLDWTGSDVAGGSGFQDVDLYVSVDGGPFGLAQTDISEFAAVYTGEPGHTYSFFTLSEDNAGNREMTKTSAEATTFLYLPGVPASLLATANPSTIEADGSSTSLITFTVQDARGDAVANQSVTLTTTLGTLNVVNATSNASGVLSTTLMAGTTPGTAVVTATVGSLSHATTVEILDVAIAGLAANNNSPTELGSATTLTATITAGTRITYTWDFGDGASSSGITTTHTYGAVGDYTVVITATNSRGVMAATTSVSVTQNILSRAIPFEAGWNFVSLPLEPLTSYTAESLCQEINSQGGHVVEIDRWYASGWNNHLCGVPVNDFDIELGQGYFIRVNAASTWTIQGRAVISSQPLNFEIGWNSISVPHTDSYTAESLCQELSSQGVTAVEINRWYASGWNNHLCGVPVNDFPIEPTQGYFVKTTSSDTVVPR